MRHFFGRELFFVFCLGWRAFASWRRLRLDAQDGERTNILAAHKGAIDISARWQIYYVAFTADVGHKKVVIFQFFIFIFIK